MKLKNILFVVSIVVGQLTAASAQKYSSIGDLPLISGDTIYNCTVGYRTFGSLNKDKSNAILFCTWYMGTSEDLQENIGGKSLVDSVKYFVIAVDALGDGISTSPSNYKGTHGKKYPIITITDMVRSQYAMLRKEFGITQLHGIIGGSMGGMQVFDWIVTYPEYMKKAIAYVGTPRLSNYNRLTFSLLADIITMGKKYSMSEADQSRVYSMTFDLVLRSPEHFNKTVSHQDFQKYLARYRRDSISTERFENLLVQLSAMSDHDISLPWNNSMETAASKVKAKLFIIVSDNDLTVNPQPAIEFAKMTNAQLLQLQNDCGHLAPGCESEKCNAMIREFFDR
ncbi:MAG: alpha/beta fold hydrolase [Bacteroidetes bacterium]|nr:alpha/beta fold hydrolase [Bacteroidota bacterium]